MGSGKYSALSGTIAKMQALENISHNLSNVSTVGFKKDRTLFEATLSSFTQNNETKGINLTRIRGNHVDFSQGLLQTTGGDLDFAIDGEGFFKVRNEAGIFYTRAGQFQRGSDGTLQTLSGFTVLGENDQPLTVPDIPFEVDELGQFRTTEGESGRLAIFTADDQSLFYKQSGTLFALPAGQNSREVEKPAIHRGSLEQANINLMQEMALMMDNLRTFEAYQKVLKTYSTIGAKADELGSLG